MTEVLWMQERDIGITLVGLKPNTRLYVFFEGILVSAFVTPATTDYTLTNRSIGDFYAAGTKGSALVSDSDGRAALLFHIPPRTFLNSADNLIFIADVNDLSLLGTATTAAEALFSSTSNDPAIGLTEHDKLTIGKEYAGLSSAQYGVLSSQAQAASVQATWFSNKLRDKMSTSVINPLAQVFFVGTDGLQDSAGVYVTSIQISLVKNSGAIGNQGVCIDVRKVENGKPTAEIVPYSTLNKTASQINSTTKETFTFSTPVFLKAGEYYALCVRPEGGNPNYSIATSVVGARDRVTGAIVQKNTALGSLFISTNSGSWTSIDNEVLDLSIKKAQFTTTTNTVNQTVYHSGYVKLVNEDYEFLLISNTVGSMQQGEFAYQVSSNLFSNSVSTVAAVVTISANSRTITLGGTNTTPGFSSLSNFSSVAVTDGINHDILFINTISSNTSLTIKNLPTFSNTTTSMQIAPIATVKEFNPSSFSLILNKSTATNTVYFSANSKVIGVRSKASTRIGAVYDFVYNKFEPNFHYSSVPGTTTSLKIMHTTRKNYANTNLTEYPMNATSQLIADEVIVASKTNEQLYMAGRKSFSAQVAFTSVNQSSSPRLDVDTSGIVLHRNIINGVTGFLANTAIFNTLPGVSNTGLTLSTVTANQTPVLTGGNSRNGLITNKHVTQTVTLAPGLDSEDLVVYLTAYKPANTYLHVYGKFLSSTDSESFDSKDWTYLPQITDAGLYSDSVDLTDLKEYQYTLPTSPPSVAKSGVLTTSTSSNTVTGIGTSFTTDLAVNDLMKIYSDSAKTTAQVVKVTSIANNISLSIDNVSAFTTVNGLYEKVLLPKTAFLNDQNSGLIRYYSLSGTPYDSYITFAVKIEMSSDFSYRVPRVINLRAIAASI
jgi:hypothetical protein